MFTMLLVVLLFFIWILFLTFLALFVARTLSLEYFRLGCWYISHLFFNVTRDTFFSILFQRFVVFTRDCTPCIISLQKREYCWINLFVLRFCCFWYFATKRFCLTFVFGFILCYYYQFTFLFYLCIYIFIISSVLTQSFYSQIMRRLLIATGIAIILISSCMLFFHLYYTWALVNILHK